MFDQTSRYFKLKDLSYNTQEKRGKDKHVIVYKERRFLPLIRDITLVQEVRVIAGERPDTISSRTIGDPEQFWRLCDANEMMHPLELTSEPGKILRIGIEKIF